jgi:hypothetical protein
MLRVKAAPTLAGTARRFVGLASTVVQSALPEKGTGLPLWGSPPPRATSPSTARRPRSRIHSFDSRCESAATCASPREAAHVDVGTFNWVRECVGIQCQITARVMQRLRHLRSGQVDCSVQLWCHAAIAVNRQSPAGTHRVYLVYCARLRGRRARPSAIQRVFRKQPNDA